MTNNDEVVQLQAIFLLPTTFNAPFWHGCVVEHAQCMCWGGVGLQGSHRVQKWSKIISPKLFLDHLG